MGSNFNAARFGKRVARPRAALLRPANIAPCMPRRDAYIESIWRWTTAHLERARAALVKFFKKVFRVKNLLQHMKYHLMIKILSVFFLK